VTSAWGVWRKAALPPRRPAAGAAGLWVPDLNVPVADMLPADYVSRNLFGLRFMAGSSGVGTKTIWKIWEEETALRFGKLAAGGAGFLRNGKLRLDCKRRGIVRLDVGPEAVAATFLPGRLRNFRYKSLERDGDRLIYTSNGLARPFEQVERFLEILDE
jgi:transcription-repair coupling factor (superfamily II helicase)